MLKFLPRIAFALAVFGASPALANNPLDSGPLADFLNVFRQSAIPRQLVVWTHGYAPGHRGDLDEQAAALLCPGKRPGVRIRRRSRPSGLLMVGDEGRFAETRVAATGRRHRRCSSGARICPRHMAGGMDNPLGARAIYLGSSLYRIHGSNEPDTIGAAVSSGCIRMTNNDVIDLYGRVKVGTKVVVLP